MNTVQQSTTRRMRTTSMTVLILFAVAGAFADSLFTRSAEKSGTLVSDKVDRFEVGDLITVMVRESIDASTTANTNTKKEVDTKSEAGETDNEFFVANGPQGLNLMNPKTLPNWDIGVTNETKARGTTLRKTTLNTAVTCTVKEVFPNGTIALEGERKVTMNREDSKLHVSGIARAKDVAAGNTIQSSLLANAEIVLRGKGPLWNNQRRGLFTRFLDWVSPF